MSEHYLELQHKAGTRAAAAAPPLAALPATRGEQNVQLRRLRTDWDAKLKSLRASEDSLTADAIVRVHQQLGAQLDEIAALCAAINPTDVLALPAAPPPAPPPDVAADAAVLEGAVVTLAGSGDVLGLSSFLVHCGGLQNGELSEKDTDALLNAAANLPCPLRLTASSAHGAPLLRLTARICRAQLEEQLRRATALWLAASFNGESFAPFEGGDSARGLTTEALARNDVPDSWQGTLTFKARSLVPSGVDPLEHLASEAGCDRLVSELVNWAASSASSDPAENQSVALLSVDATPQGFSDMAEQLRAASLDPRRHGWCELVLDAPFGVIAAMQPTTAARGAALLVASVPERNTDAIDWHVAAAKALCAAAAANNLLLVIHDRVEFARDLLLEALPRCCAERAAQRTRVTVINSKPAMTKKKFHEWCDGVLQELQVAATSFGATTALNEAQREALHAFVPRALHLQRSRFRELARAVDAPSDQAVQVTGGVLKAMGLLTSAALDADAATVEDAHAAKLRAVGSYDSLQELKQVAFVQLTVMNKAQAGIDRGNMLQSLQQNLEAGLASAIDAAVNAHWCPSAPGNASSDLPHPASPNGVALARLNAVLQAACAAASGQKPVCKEDWMKVFLPIKQAFKNMAEAAWSGVLHDLTQLAADRLRPRIELPPTLAVALQEQVRQLLSHPSPRPTSAVAMVRKAFQPNGMLDCPFERFEKHKEGANTAPVIDFSKLGLDLAKHAAKHGTASAVAFGAELVQSRLKKALSGKPLHRETLQRTLLSVMQEAYKARGASVLASFTIANAGKVKLQQGSLTEYMTTQRQEFLRICEDFKKAQPKREALSGLAALSPALRRVHQEAVNAAAAAATGGGEKRRAEGQADGERPTRRRGHF